MPEFRTNKYGKPYPITKPKGRGKAVVAAAVVAGGAAAAGGIGGAGSAGTAADAAASRALHAKTVQSKRAAKKGDRATAWRRLGTRSVDKKVERAIECAASSYGAVLEFFLRTPCRSLDRTLFVLADDAGGRFLVSVSWVRMPSSGTAHRLRALTDRDGTGNVAAIGAVGPRLAGTRFTGEHYDSDRRRRLVVIAEAAPLSGAPAGGLMDAATEVAVLFPAP